MMKSHEGTEASERRRKQVSKDRSSQFTLPTKRDNTDVDGGFARTADAHGCTILCYQL